MERDTMIQVPSAKIQFSSEDRLWIADRIQEVLASGQLTLGKYGAEFEKEFARLCGVRHGISVNSGTSALEIILRSLEIEGKKVLVPTNTFFATAAAVVHAGGIPVLVDMDPESFALHPEAVEKSLVPGVVGMVVVHIGGIISAQMPSLMALAERKGLWLVEDAAHAHGSSFRSQSAGSFGIAGSFSFYPTKVMTSAEGGMIVTNDDRLAEESRIYRDQGKKSFMENAHIRMGYNWRMSEPHAIIGLKHLQRLQSMISDRIAVANIYNKGLREFRNLKALKVPPDGFCNYYKYIAVMKDCRNRKELKTLLRELYGISLAGEVYEEPLHKQPVFERFASGPLPLSEDLCSRHICLPIFSGMQEEDAKQVLKALKEVIG